MHLRFVQPTLFAGLCFLLIHSAIAEPSPQPSPPVTWPPPTPTVPPVSPPSGVNAEEAIPVIITYGEGPETRTAITQALMLPVGVPRLKSVTVSLLLPSTYAGQDVALRLYDGGQVGPAAVPGTPTVPPGTRNGGTEALTFVLKAARDGTVHFNFEAGALLGLYRLAAAVGPNRYLLQFYAVRPRSTSDLPSPDLSPPPTPHPTTTPPPE